MHTASSLRILPREESCANFSTSKATVPTADTADLKEYQQNGKKNRPSPPCSLTVIVPSSPVHLACLHPSIGVKTSTKHLLPPCPSLTLHWISTIPPSKPAPCSGCIHFLSSVHPLSLESDVPSFLHPSVLCPHLYVQFHPVS